MRLCAVRPSCPLSGPSGPLSALCSLQPGLTVNSLSQVDFEDVDMRTPVERRRGEEQQRHRDRLWRARAEQAVREMAGGALGTGGPAFPPESLGPAGHAPLSCACGGHGGHQSGEGACIQLVMLV